MWYPECIFNVMIRPKGYIFTRQTFVLSWDVYTYQHITNLQGHILFSCSLPSSRIISPIWLMWMLGRTLLSSRLWYNHPPGPRKILQLAIPPSYTDLVKFYFLKFVNWTPLLSFLFRPKILFLMFECLFSKTFSFNFSRHKWNDCYTWDYKDSKSFEKYIGYFIAGVMMKRQ